MKPEFHSCKTCRYWNRPADHEPCLGCIAVRGCPNWRLAGLMAWIGLMGLQLSRWMDKAKMGRR